MDSGLNNIPVGEAVISNFTLDKRCAMLSAKHDPSESIDEEWSMPRCKGFMGIMEVFLDTIVICTMTALVILLSGVTVPYGQAAGAELTISGFTSDSGKGWRLSANEFMYRTMEIVEK